MHPNRKGVQEETPNYFGHRERLKERFDKAGLEGFSEHEILELLLFYVRPRVDTKPIAKALLSEFESLEGVLSAKSEALKAVPGIGEEAARFIHLIKKISEFAIRAKAVGTSPTLCTNSELLKYLCASMANLVEEQFRVIFLDGGNRILKDEVISHGIENQTVVYPRLVMKKALSHHATGIIAAHNHPSGRLIPSQADRDITRALQAAAETLGINFFDHLIIGREGKGYFSFRENGLL